MLKKTCLLLAVPLIALTACGDKEPEIASAGTSAAPTATQSATQAAGRGAFYDAQLAYVRCVRKNGLPEWPDPKLSGHPDMEKIMELQRRLQEGANLAKGQEKLNKAMRPCMGLMNKADTLAPRKEPQKLFEALLKHAKCMRKNGVTQFANPTMDGGSVIPGGDPDPADPAFDPDSPAYKQAREACQDLLPDGAEQ
ncbi:hypothetical protein AB0J63_42530 [Streptosporangium canum]|uniref:hypothetical protein n=1 Tax=Streptosporangium canum TaxID=324952 RepID=UPI00343D8EBF